MQGPYHCAFIINPLSVLHVCRTMIVLQKKKSKTTMNFSFCRIYCLVAVALAISVSMYLSEDKLM